MRVHLVMTVMALSGLGGCTFLPGAAPTAYEIEHSPKLGETEGYFIHPLDLEALEVLKSVPVESLRATFNDIKPLADLRVGPGDTLQISIWEAGASGLFAQSTLNGPGAHSATFQPVLVAQDGFVSVPFAGRIKASGKTAEEVQRLIEGALKNQALDPQVMVLLATPAANVATVGGDVNQPGVRALDFRGDRLLDTIAAAGGVKYPTYQCDVQLTRHGKTVTLPLQRVVDDPAENIFIDPGDNIYVMFNPPSFTVYGATNGGHSNRYTFDLPRLYLTDAISEAGGLVDTVNDDSGIYLFRSIPKEQASSLFPNATMPDKGPVPVIFRADLSVAGGFVLAKETEVKNRDLFLVTNAKGTQLLKLMGIVRGVSQPIGDIRDTGASKTTVQLR